MNLLKITQKFEMTQQIRTISRANGLRSLMIIIAYHNRGIITQRSSKVSRSLRNSLDDIANDLKESFASRGSRFSIAIRITLSRRLCVNIFSHAHFLLINLLLHKYVSLAAQRNSFASQNLLLL